MDDAETQPFLDQYSLIHMAVGILFYFWKISFFLSTLTQATFMLLNNSEEGSKLFSRYAPQYPYTAKKHDSWINMVGDNMSFNFGWLLASAVDTSLVPAGQEKQIYEAHCGPIVNEKPKL